VPRGIATGRIIAPVKGRAFSLSPALSLSSTLERYCARLTLNAVVTRFSPSLSLVEIAGTMSRSRNSPHGVTAERRSSRNVESTSRGESRRIRRASQAERFYDRASYGSFLPASGRKWIISAAVNRAIPSSEITDGGRIFVERGAPRSTSSIGPLQFRGSFYRDKARVRMNSRSPAEPGDFRRRGGRGGKQKKEAGGGLVAQKDSRG